MKKAFNIFLYSVTGIALIIITAVIVTNKPVPVGETGDRAEMLADKMLEAANLPAWESLRYIKWTFRDKHDFVWDTWYNLAEIQYGGTRVLLSLDSLQGRAWVDGTQLAGSEKRTVLQEAWEYWCNDSFWLNPIVKIRDEGTVRQLIELDDRRQGLLVTFEEGGVTPGDSFLFKLDKNGRPTSWQMWVRMLPVKGIEFDIAEWTDLNGAPVATKHKAGPVEIRITDVVCGDHHSDLGLLKDPFTDF